MSIRPRLYVGLGFGYKSQTVYPRWSSMTTRAFSAQIERGREARLDDVLPATAVVVLKNTDGALLPSSTKSPYRAAGKTLVLPSVQMMVGEGFVGRVAMSTPQFYFQMDDSTTPAREYFGAMVLQSGGFSFKPTYRTPSYMSYGILFDGRTQAMWTGDFINASTLPELHLTNSTGMSVMAVVRIDEKGVARTQAITAGISTLAVPAEVGVSLSYTSQNKARLWGLMGTVNSTTVVACTTGVHFLVGVLRKGSKPVLYVDGVATSGAVASTGGFSVPHAFAVGGLGATTAAASRMFKGIVDEFAVWTNRGLLSSEVAAMNAEYANKWRPGRVHFRGQVNSPDGYSFDFGAGKGPPRDATVTVKGQDWLGRLASVTMPPTGPSSSTAPPVRLFAGDTPKGRIQRVMNKAAIPKALRLLDVGQSLLLGTSWNVNALGICQQIAESENGGFYALSEGPIKFDQRNRQFTDLRMVTAGTTYSSKSSRPGFVNPVFGWGRRIRNDVAVTNTSYTTELMSTASQDTYGVQTTAKAMLNQFAADMVEQGRFVLIGYSTARYVVAQFTVLPYASTLDYAAFCSRELRDTVKVNALLPGTTKLSTSSISIEKEVVTIARHQAMVTYNADAANRWSTVTPSSGLIVLDSTVAARRLNSGRLSF